MPRKARWAAPLEPNSGNDPVITSETPPDVVRQLFARRLWTMLSNKGWNQSELSRRAGIARDSVSTYVRGLAMPDPANAAKIAQAFGITVQELNPASVQVASAESMPSVEMKQAVGNADRAWLRVNKEVTFDTAVKILALLNGSAN